MRWEDLKGTENTRSVIDRNFVVATVAPPTKQAEVAAEPTLQRHRWQPWLPPLPAAAPARGAPARGGAGGGRGGGSKRG